MAIYTVEVVRLLTATVQLRADSEDAACELAEDKMIDFVSNAECSDDFDGEESILDFELKTEADTTVIDSKHDND